jgi:hypothetical protein
MKLRKPVKPLFGLRGNRNYRKDTVGIGYQSLYMRVEL